MLKKFLRLGRRDLEVFFKSRTRYTKGRLLVLRSRTTPYPIARFAFVVSGPKRRFAAKRNLMRRRMSEAVRVLLPKIPKCRDFVFFLKLENRATPSFRAIKEDIDYVLTKADL